MNVKQLENNLREALKRQADLRIWAKSNAHTLRALIEAGDAVAQAERALAAAQGQEYAEPLDMVFFLKAMILASVCFKISMRRFSPVTQ